MIRKLILAFFITSLFFGCGGTKEEDQGDTPATMGGTDDAEVSSDAMAFDPMGSDSGNIPGLNTVNFEYDKARLTSRAKKTLQENAEWIKSHSDINIQIEGHCDSRGSIEYNLSLGERRAKATKDYLVSLGVAPESVSIISYGEEKLLDYGDTESAHAKNRRANFVPLAQ